jgi:hypothetical protein
LSNPSFPNPFYPPIPRFSCVDAEGFGLGTKDNIEHLLDFEGYLGLCGQQEVFGGEKLDDVVPISFKATLSDDALI